MRILTQTFSTFLLFSFVIGLCQCSPSKEQKQKDALHKLVEAFNKSTPMQVDAETRFEKCEIDGKELTFFYTISDSVFQVKDFEEMAVPVIKSSIKDNPNIQVYREYGIILKYRYTDTEGELLYELILKPSEY